MERVTMEGDNVASQLTIAQAALLNLRAQGLWPVAKIGTPLLLEDDVAILQ